MRTRTFLLLLVLAALTPSAHAQIFASQSVNASLTVQASLSVSKISDLNLGSVTAGQTASLSPGATPGSGQTMGVVQIDHNSSVTVVGTLASVLAGTGAALGATALPITFSCGFSTASSGALAGSSNNCLTATRTVTAIGTSQTTYLQVGGSVATLSATIPGTYTGSATFVITQIL